MTNPYQAPLEDNEVAPISRTPYGAVGCGCAAIAILAFLMIGFSALSFVSAPAPVSAPTAVPSLAPVPAPVPQNAAPPPIQQLQEVDSAD